MIRSILAIVFCLACTACGSDATTGGEVILQTALRADPEIEGSFATETGWQVKLSRAAVSVGALYYFDGEPAFVSTDRRAWYEHLAALFTPGVAHAHPGHYVSGTAMGQMIEPYSADLLAGTTTLPEGNGITGFYRSGRFTLAVPKAGPALEALAGNVAVVEGVATRGEETVHFRLAAQLADVTRSAAEGKVEGCEFEETEVDSDGTVTVTIEPHVWFDLVDFTGVAPGSAEAPTVIAADETAHIAFALGLAQLSAYHFSFTP